MEVPDIANMSQDNVKANMSQATLKAHGSRYFERNKGNKLKGQTKSGDDNYTDETDVTCCDSDKEKKLCCWIC